MTSGDCTRCASQAMLSTMSYVVGIIFGLFSIGILLIIIRIHSTFRRANHFKNKNEKSIGFLHPHCAGGGGGERVLWEAVSALLQQRDKLKIGQIVIILPTIRK